jgi:cytochrome c peroxidase
MPRKHPLRALLCLAPLLAGSALAAQPPGPLLPPPVPPGNPITQAKVDLGKTLFWDEQMSATRTVACATCHAPEAGGGDPRLPTPAHPGRDGVFGTPDDVFGSPGVIANPESGGYLRDTVFALRQQVTGRKAQSAIMAAYNATQFWDGRRDGVLRDPHTNQVVLPLGASLENQALEPPLSAAEMAHAGADWTDVEQRLARSAPLALATDVPAALAGWLGQRSYADLFQEAFGTPEITAARVAMAIATYERILVPDQAPIDALLRNGIPLPPLESRGQQVFLQIGRCATCHGAPTFGRQAFFHIGVRPPQEDVGRFAITNAPQDNGAFKVPSLRNVGLRTRFFHNGGKRSLEDVVDFYARGGDFRAAPNIAIQPFLLSPQDRTALLAFLRNALTDPRATQGLPPFDHPTLYSMSGRAPQTYGAGSPGSNGRPSRIFTPDPPMLGNPQLRLAVDDGVAGLAMVLLVDTVAGSRSLLGVNVNVDLSAALIALHGSLRGAPGTIGWTSFATALPSDPALAGVPVFVQVITADPGTPSGLASSAGLRLDLFAPR